MVVHTKLCPLCNRPLDSSRPIPDAHSIFLRQQTAVDYSCLSNVNNCLPTNVDGITERLGQFLMMELKHGEELSTGQKLMLCALAAVKEFTVLVIDCEWSPPNNKGARSFTPETFRYMDKDGVLGPVFPTSVKDFAARYDIWCRTPSHGVRPFVCSPEEFKAVYLKWLPGHYQQAAMEAVQAAREVSS